MGKPSPSTVSRRGSRTYARSSAWAATSPKIAGFEEDTPHGKRIAEERGRIFQLYISALRPFECVQQLVRRMKDEGLEVAIASSAEEKELEKLLEIAGVRDLVQCTTSSDDADASKPEPDIIEAARKCLNLPRDEVLMVGDTPYDIEAAKRAGIETIALRTGGWDDEKLAGALPVERRDVAWSKPCGRSGSCYARVTPAV